MFKDFFTFIDSILARDPAARSRVSVALLFPGVHAMGLHRIAHWLWRKDLPFLGLAVSQVCRGLTGIEIHPGATIGRNFYIHHGMGVVIGETAEIGDNVMMFHGATLGATANERVKRHPTIRDGAIIGAGAQILGPVIIGLNAKIGANAVVTRDVPQGATVAAPQARVITGGASEFVI